MINDVDFKLLRGFADRQRNRQMDKQTNICECSVAFATENCRKNENRWGLILLFFTLSVDGGMGKVNDAIFTLSAYFLDVIPKTHLLINNLI